MLPLLPEPFQHPAPKSTFKVDLLVLVTTELCGSAPVSTGLQEVKYSKSSFISFECGDHRWKILSLWHKCRSLIWFLSKTKSSEQRVRR